MSPATSTIPHRLACLDYFRALAVTSVFIAHTIIQFIQPAPGMEGSGYFRFFVALGQFGVAVFFVLSGFCIHLSHCGSREASDWRIFFIRRFWRIYPAYFAALIFFAFIFPDTRLIGPEFTLSQFLFQFISHLFLVHNFNHETLYAIDSPMWSLALEFQLYLLYPIVLWLERKWGWYRTLFLIAFVEFGIRTVGAFHQPLGPLPWPTWIKGNPLAYWFSWSIGAALASAYLRRSLFPGNLAVGLLLLAIATASIYTVSTAFYLFPLFAMATLLILGYVLKIHLSERPRTLVGRGWAYIGVMSYSIYLLHQPLMISSYEWLIPIGLPVWESYLLCLLTYLPILALAHFTYQWIERFGLFWGKKYARKIVPAYQPITS